MRLLPIAVLVFVTSLSAEQSAAPVILTVPTPTPQRFELAVEVELQWLGPAPITAMRPTSQSSLKISSAGRTVFETSGARTLQQMGLRASALKAENPGAEAYLVLYEAGQPRSEATRSLLGREIAVLFNRKGDHSKALRNAGGLEPTPLPAVPNAYVVKAEGPEAALDLVRVLQALPGVTAAYPLLKKQRFGR